MVKSIKQGMTIDAHPHKQLMQILIDVENVCGTDLRLPPRKTYSLMVGYTISQNIDSIKFVEHVGIVYCTSADERGLFGNMRRRICPVARY